MTTPWKVSKCSYEDRNIKTHFAIINSKPELSQDLICTYAFDNEDLSISSLYVYEEIYGKKR